MVTPLPTKEPRFYVFNAGATYYVIDRTWNHQVIGRYHIGADGKGRQQTRADCELRSKLHARKLNHDLDHDPNQEPNQ